MLSKTLTPPKRKETLSDPFELGWRIVDPRCQALLKRYVEEIEID